MAKLSNKTTAVTGKRAPLRSTNERTLTYNGAPGVKLDRKTELFTLSASNMVGEDTYYETSNDRDNRFAALVQEVTRQDPTWVAAFIPYLRNEMFMRTASIVAAAEYTLAGGDNAAKVIDSALQRADEPAEFLAYWMQRDYGWTGGSFPLKAPKLPQSVRKGLARASVRLYNEYSVMKYNGLSRGVSIANVLNLVHPTPKDEVQNRLFKYVIDRAYGNNLNLEGLSQVETFTTLNAMTPEVREGLLSPKLIKDAGMTWESLSSWGPMDAKRWEMVIPSMGYMALLRNLRNFEQAGISKSYVKQVCDRLTNPDEVAKSKQFPFRFLSAYEQVANLQWAASLEEALNLSVNNIPTFSGKTLVAVDVSGSMDQSLSGKSTMTYWRAGAVFGVAMALRNDSDFIAFGTTSRHIPVAKGSSILPVIKKVAELRRTIGYSTNQWRAVRENYSDHDRVVIFTDEQSSDESSKMPAIKTVHTFNFAGYGRSQLDYGSKGRYLYGGFSDKMFTLMNILETTGHGDWPFIG